MLSYEVFERNTAKFWVHPRDVMRLKVLVAQHVPISVYGRQEKLTSGGYMQGQIAPYQLVYCLGCWPRLRAECCA